VVCVPVRACGVRACACVRALARACVRVCVCGVNHHRYAALQPYINARATSSQRDGAMGVAEYARLVAEAALSLDPPWELVAGGSAWYYHLVGRYMPKGMWAKHIARKLGLHLLGSDPSRPASGWLAALAGVLGKVQLPMTPAWYRSRLACAACLGVASVVAHR
jgi:hypothetical protein